MSIKFLVFLLMADVLVSLAMASRVFPNIKKDDQSEPTSDLVDPSPSTNDQHKYNSLEPTSRELEKHHHQHRHNNQEASSPVGPPSESPSQAQSIPPVGQPASSSENIGLQEQAHEVDLRKRHHSVDKSVAGGGVILGGLATTFLVAVFCYIRATRRHKTVVAV